MKKTGKILILFFAATLVLLGHTNLVEAKTLAKAKVKAKTPHLVRIFYYQGGKNARASFAQHLKSIDVLAPQSYSINSEGMLHGNIDSTLLALAQKNKIKVMPLVTNLGFSRIGVQAFLDDSAKQDAAIQMMADEAVRKTF